MATDPDTGLPVARASGFPNFNDCERRGFAKMMPEIVRAAGFELRETPQTIGAAVGQSCHSAAAYTLQQKLSFGELGNASEAEDRAIATFGEEMQRGVLWDNVTHERGTGQRQVQRMVKAYRASVAPRIEPELVEKRFSAKWGQPDPAKPTLMLVSGQPDCYENEAIQDLKTGKIARVNLVQYGTYALLARGHDHPVTKIREDYLPRVSLKKEQPSAETIEMDAAVAETEAMATIERFARGMIEFLKTGNPTALAANPQSMLCGANYCPAHSTKFCRAHKGAK